jgi:hypothetical protein
MMIRLDQLEGLYVRIPRLPAAVHTSITAPDVPRLVSTSSGYIGE